MHFRFSRVFAAAFAATLFLATPSVARANSIGPICGSCQGGVYTLSNLGAVADIFAPDGLSDTWQIAFTIDTSGYTGTGVRIDEVAIKVSADVDLVNLISAPGGAGKWQIKAGGINADGCSGEGSGFDCADWIVGSLGGAVIPGGPYTWVFNVDVVGPLMTGLNQASIKARYVNGSDEKVGALVSEDVTLGPGDPVTPVPEPASLTLLGAGLSAYVARRRMRAASV